MLSYIKKHFNLIRNYQINHRIVFHIVLTYHFLATYFSFNFIYQNSGDALNYWFISKSQKEFIQTNPVALRENLLYYINYFFTQHLSLPFWGGFLIYSSVGLLGIWFLFQTILNLNFYNKNLLIYIPILFLPSMHFWTSMLGKEPICFLGISLIFYSLKNPKLNLASFIIGFIFLSLIRPHVGVLLALAIFISYLFKNKFHLSYLYAFISFVGISLYFILQSHWLQGISIENFQYLFQVHHEAFRETNAYVPLEEYNIFYKFFTFYFRPLPFEYNTLWGWFSGLENIFSLSIFITGLYCLAQLFFKHRYRPGKLELSIIFFFILLAGVLSLAYSNFGLISRMKNQSLPFMLMLCVYWISMYFNQRNHDPT